MAANSTWEARLHQTSASALYVHLPFCVRKCHYCDFSSFATKGHDPLMAAYAKAIAQHIHEAAGLGLLEMCETAYFGGGTPTLVGAPLAALVEQAARVTRAREISCEANPESLSDELLGRLAQSGATRVSLGVQSTNDAELAALGRAHGAALALERIGAAASAGLDVSADLMCAIPGQRDATWSKSVTDVIDAGAEHVSVYPLAIEEGTAFYRRYGDEPQPWNDERLQAERMELAASLLSKHGFARYEVASYARPGKDCKHNQAYWTGMPYLGFGTSAASMLTREGYAQLRYANAHLPVLDEQCHRVRLTITSTARKIAAARAISDLHFDLEFLTAKQAAAEDLMLESRMVRGISGSLLDHARALIGTSLDRTLERLMNNGFVRLDAGGAVVPTEKGWLLGNELYGMLWGLATEDVLSASC